MTTHSALATYARNVHSQAGEDGIIAEIFRRIGAESKWCVEFGAWDGKVASNSAALVADGWSAVLIEGDPAKFQDLRALYREQDDVVTLLAMVGWEGQGRLDALLAATPIPQRFDLLSIDIDGNDYHVWAAVETYRPRVVVVEFNPTIPNGVIFVQPADPKINQGSSIDALVELGSRKSYTLVAATEFNAFFVEDVSVEKLGVSDTSVTALRTDTTWQTTVFFGYDGRAFLSGSRGLYWHGVPVPQRVRVMPRMFEGFPGSFGPMRQRALHGWRLWRHLKHRVALRREARRGELSGRGPHRP